MNNVQYKCPPICTQETVYFLLFVVLVLFFVLFYFVFGCNIYIIYIWFFFRGAVESIRCLDEIYKQKKSLRDVFNQEAVGLRNRSAVKAPHKE